MRDGLGGGSERMNREHAEATTTFIPEETIGDGAECVYLYFNEAERKLAKHEGREWWPCKIGFTSGSLAVRPRAQNQGQAWGYCPLWACSSGPVTVGVWSARFTLRSTALLRGFGEAVGEEWFGTLPKIREWQTCTCSIVCRVREAVN